jgi:uncharacterized protein (TIGR02996 family)
MHDRDLFLSAILANPDDDLPRLVFADYLDESGDAERAEFIRVQCELAGLPVHDLRRPVLQAREVELLRANKGRWEVPGFRGTQVLRRGFVEAIGSNAEELISSADRLFAAAPIRELRVYVLGTRAEQLARIPGMHRIESLDLSNNAFWAGYHFLTTAPFSRLRRLTWRNVMMWADEITALGATPVASRLDFLDVSGSPFSIEGGGVEALASAPGFAGLSTLIAASDGQPYYNCIHAQGAAAIARSTTLNRLRVLDLSQHSIGDAGIGSLVRSANAASLETLDVSANEIGLLGEAGIEEIIASPHLGQLRELRLGGERSRPDRRNRIDRRAATLLARWGLLGGGLTVDLRGCDVDDSARVVLGESPWAGRFRLDPVGNG